MPRVLKRPWLDSFIEYVEQVNKEIPENYIVWSGISLLSSAMRGNTYIYYKGVKMPPNQYIILTGPPGIGKGSIIKPAVEIGKESSTINFIEDKATPEKLIDILAGGQLRTVPNPANPTQGGMIQDHSGCVAANELAIFLNSSETMHSVLCALWDQTEFSYQTKNKNSYKVDGIYFSLLAGCTPDYLRTLVKDKMAHVTGGFTARCLFIYSSELGGLEDSAFDAPNTNRTQLFHDLVDDLKYISNLKGRIEFTDEAKDYWKTKYKEHREISSNGHYYSDAYQNFRSRISSHILKTSLAICVSESDDLRITKAQLERATRLVEHVRNSVDIVFKYIGERPIEVAMERVADFVKAKGFASRPEILRFNRQITAEELEIILKTLELAGRIALDTNSQGRAIYKSLI